MSKFNQMRVCLEEVGGLSISNPSRTLNMSEAFIALLDFPSESFL